MKPPTTTQQIYSDVASIWREAGAHPLDAVEALIGMMDHLQAAAPADGDHGSAELSYQAWQESRAQRYRKLNLSELDSGRHVERTPGLIERTRRAVLPIAPLLRTPSTAREFVGAIVSFLAHAQHSGLGRTDFGYGKWPEYLPALFSALLDKPGSEPLYVPFEGSGWLPLLMAEAGWSVACELPHTQMARIFKLCAEVAGWSLDVHVSDPIREPSWVDGRKLHSFAHAAAVTTFGMRNRDPRAADPYRRFPLNFLHGEAQQIAHLIAQTHGKILVVVPEGFLFRTTGSERDYKEQLVRTGTLSAVIRLPKNAFAPYANVQTSMLVLATDARPGNVVFIDAASAFEGRTGHRYDDGVRQAAVRIADAIASRKPASNTASVDYGDIAKNDFNISVDRYVRSDHEQKLERILQASNTAELIDIADITRPQSFPPDDGNETHSFAEVGLQDIGPDGLVASPAKQISIDDRNLAKVLRHRLQSGDVLLSVRGRIGAVGIVPEVEASGSVAGWLASQAFVVLRLRETSPINRQTLYRYLSSHLGQALLHSLSTGATVPMITMGDLKRLRIIIPTPDEEREIARQVDKINKLRAQIAQLEKLTAELNAASWPMTKIGSI